MCVFTPHATSTVCVRVKLRTNNSVTNKQTKTFSGCFFFYFFLSFLFFVVVYCPPTPFFCFCFVFVLSNESGDNTFDPKVRGSVNHPASYQSTHSHIHTPSLPSIHPAKKPTTATTTTTTTIKAHVKLNTDSGAESVTEACTEQKSKLSAGVFTKRVRTASKSRKIDYDNSLVSAVMKRCEN